MFTGQVCVPVEGQDWGRLLGSLNLHWQAAWPLQVLPVTQTHISQALIAIDATNARLMRDGQKGPKRTRQYDLMQVYWQGNHREDKASLPSRTCR